MKMLFNSPLSPEKADRLIDLLDLDANSHVVDFGCGTGEFLIRLIQRYGANCTSGIGIDLRTDSLEQARSSAQSQIVETHQHQIEFTEINVRDYSPKSNLDCGICMGATYALSMNEPAYPETLRRLSEVVRPGGKLLIGESFWTQTPDPDYLAFIGEPVGTYRTHLVNVELAKQAGLTPLYAATSSLDEWDDFEWQHNIVKENQTAAMDEEQAAKHLKFSRDWRMAYLRWGRGTMGFGFYLFQR